MSKSSESARPVKKPRTGLIALSLVVIVVLALAFGVRALYRSATSHLRAQDCSVGAFPMELDQAAVASRMVGVVVTRGLPERAAVLVLAAGLQESKLRNLAGGDRDSVGVLQQRPSQGWGTPTQISDVRYATGKFLDAMLKVTDWQNGPLAATIQAVQISADGDAYSQHEGQAQAVADALTGVTAAGISCSFTKPGTISTPAAVISELTSDLPVNPPTNANDSISVPSASWTSSAWFVANASRLGIASVRFSGKQWTPSQGWRNDVGASASAVTATLSK